jgi:phosphatidate phosphatase PAH1
LENQSQPLPPQSQSQPLLTSPTKPSEPTIPSTNTTIPPTETVSPVTSPSPCLTSQIEQKEIEMERENKKTHQKTLRPTSKMIKMLNLKPGCNSVTFQVFDLFDLFGVFVCVFYCIRFVSS